MSNILRGSLLLAMLCVASLAHAEGASASKSTKQSKASNARAQAVLADQIQSCRQHVIQLNEQSRVTQKKLAALRSERKTIGVSGGEMARFKLTNIDQEIRENSRQHQSLITEIDAETKRCDSLEEKLASGNASPPAPTTKPAAKPKKPPRKP